MFIARALRKLRCQAGLDTANTNGNRAVQATTLSAQKRIKVSRDGHMMGLLKRVYDLAGRAGDDASDPLTRPHSVALHATPSHV